MTRLFITFLTVLFLHCSFSTVSCLAATNQQLAANTAPTPFDLITPDDGSVLRPAFVTIWEESTDSDGLTYTIQIATDDSFSNIVYTQQNILQNLTAIPDTALQDPASPGNYLCKDSNCFWRVLAIDSFGATTISTTTRSFIVNPVAATVPAYLTGFITDSLTGTPITTATIRINTTNYPTTSKGAYLIPVEGGFHLLTVSASGYHSKIIGFTAATGTVVANNVQLQPIPVTVQVTFNSNGGSAVASQTIPYNTLATIPPAPTRTGYTFAGWYSDSALTATFAFTTPITADTTLYAKWTINTYTVTFNSNSGSAVASQSVLYNTLATEPPAPTRTGYTFSGWYGDSALTAPFAFTTPITANTTLYAKWTINSYSVTFNSNGGSAVASQSVPYNTLATEPPAPTRTGYTFSGWYGDSALTTPFSFSTPITADTTLYAKWTINTYTVAFTSNGGSAVASQTIPYNTLATVPTAPARTGYTFAGWYSDSALTTSFSFSTPITADTTLYAKWVIISYTVEFTSNGGSTVANQSVPYNTLAAEPPDPTRTGYTFSGWYSDSGLTAAFAFTTPIAADTTLFAKWTIIKAGDCDKSGTVTIAELQSAVSMFLGLRTVVGCVDRDANNSVSITEVQAVINAFLEL